MRLNAYGYGAPYYRVYFGDRELSANITSFVYSYAEEEDDKLTVVFETDDVTIPDQEGFQDGDKWKILWGFIKGTVSDTRTVIVEDIKPRYNNKGLTLTITCLDKAAKLKKNSSQANFKDATIDDVAKKIAEENGLEYEGVVKDEGGLAVVAGASDNVRRPAEQIIIDGIFDGNYTSAVDNTFVQIDSTFLLYEGITQGNKNDFQFINDKLDKEEGGPYVLEGRDDKLRIKKRNFNQKPIATFVYRHNDGVLLLFEPQTKNRTKKSSTVNTKVATFNKETNTYVEANATELSDTNTRLGDVIDGNQNNMSARDIEANNINPIIIPDGEEARDYFGLTPLYGTNELSTEKVKEDYITDDDGFLIPFFTPAIESTAVKITPSEFFLIEGPSNTIVSPEDGLDKAVNQANNQRTDSSLKKNPAKLIIEGNPFIVAGKIVTILGVSKKYSGNYYITKAVHTINQHQGYIVTCTLVRNAVSKTGNESPDKIDAKDVGLSKNKIVGPTTATGTSKTVKSVDGSKSTIE